MPDISSLTAEIDRLTPSVSFWNSAIIVLMIGVATVATGLVIAQQMAFRKADALASATDQLAKLKEGVANQKIAEALRQAGESNEAAGEANERAGKAQASLASAEQQAAEANTKAEGFRLDIAQANQRAAEANRVAEQERLARIQLEARLAGRVVTPEQQNRLRAAFAPLKGKTIDVVILGDTPEISFVANAISQSMKDEGVLVNELHPMGVTAKGVLAGVKPDAPDEFKQAANEMIAILRETLVGGVGLWDFNAMDFSKAAAAFGSSPGAAPIWTAPLRIFVGSK